MLNEIVSKLNRRLKESEYLQALEDISKLELKVVDEANVKTGGGRTIGSKLLILMVVNKIIADGVESVPSCWQTIGILPMTIFLVIIVCISALSVLIMIKCMALIPGNHDLTYRYEYMNVVEAFLTPAQQTVVRLCFIYVLLYSTAEILDLARLFNSLLILPISGGKSLTNTIFDTILGTSGSTSASSIRDFTSLGREAFLTNNLSIWERYTLPTYVHAIVADFDVRFSTSSGQLFAYAGLWGLIVFLSHYNLEENQWVSVAAFTLSAIVWPLVFLVSLAKVLQSMVTFPSMPHFSFPRRFLLYRQGANRKFLEKLVRALLLTRTALPRQSPHGHLRGLDYKPMNGRAVSEPIMSDPAQTPWAPPFVAPGYTAILDLDVSKLGLDCPLPEVPHDGLKFETKEFDVMSEFECSTCYSDLCFDYMWEQNLAQCPNTRKTQALLTVKSSAFINMQITKLFEQTPHLPTLFRKAGGWLSSLTVLAKVFTLTEIIPSVSNEVRKEVNITSTCWWAIIFSAVVTTIFTIIIATAFPIIYNLHPIAIVLEALFPRGITNSTILLYNALTDIPNLTMNLVTLRYNLVNTRILSNHQALWFVALGPVGVSFFTLYFADLGDALDTLCSLAIGYWVPLWLYVKAMKQSPLALRDDVRKDLLRMSISGFRPVNGTPISNVQIALRKWAKYAGRRDAQLRILLKIDEPEERRQFIRKQTSLVSQDSSRLTSNSSLPMRRNSVGSCQSSFQQSSRGPTLSQNSGDDHMEETWSVAPSEPRQRNNSAYSLESLVPEELKKPPARSHVSPPNDSKGPKLNTDVGYMSKRWQAMCEEIETSSENSSADQMTARSDREAETNTAQRHISLLTKIDDNEDTAPDDYEIWQLMFPISDIIAHHHTMQNRVTVRLTKAAKGKSCSGRKDKSIRFAEQLVTNAQSNSESLSSRNRLAELRVASMARFNERVDDDLQMLLRDTSGKEHVTFETSLTSLGASRTPNSEFQSILRSGTRHLTLAAASISPTAGGGLTASYQDDSDEGELLYSSRPVADDDLSADSVAVTAYRRVRQRLATNRFQTVLAMTSSSEYSSTVTDDFNFEEVVTSSRSGRRGTDDTVEPNAQILQLTSQNLAKFSLQSETMPKVVMVREYLQEVNAQARNAHEADLMRLVTESPHSCQRRITVTLADNPSPSSAIGIRSPRIALQNRPAFERSLTLIRDVAPRMIDAMTPESRDCHSPLAHQVSLTTTFKTGSPVKSWWSERFGWIIRMWQKCTAHLYLIHCFYNLSGSLQRSCSFTVAEPPDVALLSRIMSRELSAGESTVASVTRNPNTPPNGKEKIAVKDELDYLVKIQRFESGSSPLLGKIHQSGSSAVTVATCQSATVAMSAVSDYYIIYPRKYWFRIMIVLIRVIRSLQIWLSNLRLGCKNLLGMIRKRLWPLKQTLTRSKTRGGAGAGGGGASESRPTTNTFVLSGSQEQNLESKEPISSESGGEESLVLLPSSNSSSNSDAEIRSGTAASSRAPSETSRDGRRLHQLLKFRRSGRKKELENRSRHMNRMELTPVMGADQQMIMGTFAFLVLVILPAVILMESALGYDVEWGPPATSWIVDLKDFEGVIHLTDIHYFAKTATWAYYVAFRGYWPVGFQMTQFL